MSTPLNFEPNLKTFPWFYGVSWSKKEANRSKGSWNIQSENTTLFRSKKYPSIPFSEIKNDHFMINYRRNKKLLINILEINLN